MTVLDLRVLSRADADEAARFFADADAEELVAAIVATGDDELIELIGRDEVRPVAIDGVLVRLGEYAVPDRLAQMHGVVRIDLERRGTLLERHAIEFTHGEIELHRHVEASEPTDVVLRTSLLRFVRIVSGQGNAALEYLSGKLDIEGDADLALAMGGLFRVPGTQHVAFDPTDLDPTDVATALKGVKADHLKRVMASGFRPVVLGEIFRRIPEFVDPAKAAGADLTIGFRLLGNPSGEVERYVVRVDHGATTVRAGAEAADEGERRDATITCEGHDFLRLATGHLSAVTGVLKGQLKVKGDKTKALALSSLIDIPTPR
ncbi:SCP2 sterol-binding domain-containing protein [Nocardioides ferulae]|uniref:SCP2 sterol-binding domain-containing protein n=1 Tax=Nocardioides ferulae TaxID=2340821 RepID=UPI000EB34209|nr:SCP2 sterol-binding domain-containing protein [Nocardioides ferulae]